MRARRDGAGHTASERERDTERDRERDRERERGKQLSVNDALLALGQATSQPPLF